LLSSIALWINLSSSFAAPFDPIIESIMTCIIMSRSLCLASCCCNCIASASWFNSFYIARLAAYCYPPSLLVFWGVVCSVAYLRLLFLDELLNFSLSYNSVTLDLKSKFFFLKFVISALCFSITLSFSLIIYNMDKINFTFHTGVLLTLFIASIYSFIVLMV